MTSVTLKPVTDPDGVPSLALFAGVVGQEQAVTALRAAARRPVHAYLFVGQPGAGARPAVRAFAAALLCPYGGCGACEACHRALAGTHLDLIEVERTGAGLDVDDARRLVTIALRRPREAARQVIVVPDVHLASRAAPALLKTIEEPPASTVFVLVADDVPPELVTVASRCVEVSFPPLRAAQVTSWLVDRGVPPERAKLVAQGAGGDIERARLLAEDPDFAARLGLWQEVPSRLDGSGAVAGEIARELLDAVERALDPLRARHAAEIETMEAEAEIMGERGIAGRKGIEDRQHREERRWRTDELRAGLGVLARAYRDRLSGYFALPATRELTRERGHRSDEARDAATAVALVVDAAAALRRNAQETLLLEALFVRLGQLGA